MGEKPESGGVQNIVISGESPYNERYQSVLYAWNRKSIYIAA